MTAASERLARVGPAHAAAHVLADDEFAAVAANVASLGWPDGFHRTLDTLSPERTRHLQREMWARHAGWKGLFPPAHRRLAVVYEAGYGSISIALAEEFATVVAIVPDANHHRIVRARADWLRIPNLTVLVRTQAAAPGSVADAIAVHGFDPVTTSALVDEALRIQQRGPHTAMFVGLQGGGRAAAGAVSRIRRQLQQQFSEVEQFAFDRGLVDSSELIAARAGSWRLRAAARLAPWRDRGVGLVARSTAEDTLFDAVIKSAAAQYVQRGHDQVRFHCARRMFSTPEGFSLVLESPQTNPLIVRIALNERTAGRFRTNFESLRFLAGDVESSKTPMPLLAGEIQGNAYFAESMLPGTALRRLLGRSSEPAAMHAAVQWIAELHVRTRVVRQLADDEMSAHVLEPIAEAFRFLGHPADDRRCRALQGSVQKAFDGQALPLVFSHGDYSVDNVLVDTTGASVTGVFDWDLASHASLPLLDVLYLLLSRNAAKEPRPFAEHAANLLTGAGLPAADRAAIRDYCEALGIAPRVETPLVIMTWVNHLARRIRSAEPYRWPGHDSEFGRAFLEAAASLQLLR